MTNYRRNRVAGGCFFFTVNLAERRLRLLIEHLDILRTAFRYTRRRHPFNIDAIVILPDHLHAIWSLPDGDSDFALRWRLHTIRNDDDYARHMDYIHFNPVKHGLVHRVRDWRHSSFHRLVRLGVYPDDWAGDVRDGEMDFGER
jgi:putative transposase